MQGRFSGVWDVIFTPDNKFVLCLRLSLLELIQINQFVMLEKIIFEGTGMESVLKDMDTKIKSVDSKNKDFTSKMKDFEKKLDSLDVNSKIKTIQVTVQFSIFHKYQT